MDTPAFAPTTGGVNAPPTNVIMVRGQVYEPAIGPRLKILLAFIFLAVAFLGATGVYLMILGIMERSANQLYQTYFSLLMLLVHTLVGVAFIPPFLFFGIYHLLTARKRKNRLAVKLGVTMFVVGISVVLTGVALITIEGLPRLQTDTLERDIIRWLHVALPAVAVALYVMHRRAGPDIQWAWGAAWGVGVAAFCAVMIGMHSHDPRKANAKGSPEGEKYFHPSAALTPDGKFIPAKVMMMDEYCLKCHQDIYNSFIHSAHKFASFNNPAYLFSVRETRKTAGIRAARWCAGCHDPVPFFSGQFDDPKFDDVNNPTAHAGITCTVCHSISHIGSRSGNGDYTIQEPIHYPLTFSQNPIGQYLNEQLIKAKPDFHKKMFLKPFHRTEAFCSTCHKVGLPQEINRYKEFLRGQNHNDSYWLSGVSGQGARAWYNPPVAKTNCAECHMPLMESNDFGARDFDGSGKRKIHNHLFMGANTGLAMLRADRGEQGMEAVIKAHEKFLQSGPDGKSPPLRIDLFGIKAGGIDSPLIDDQPLRPNLPRLVPGNTYQLEVVVRTLNIGHHFSQGTVDSNEIWIDFLAKAGERVIGRSGALEKGDDGQLDPWAHRINVLMLDRHGNRIDRRNPQDIFTPLYDHQIPPGAANVLHYRLHVPKDLKPGEPIELTVKVRYRKFDYTYMEKVHYGLGKTVIPKLPIVDMCSDKVILPVAGVAEKVPEQKSPIDPPWQRWNDYGIGCFLEGGPEGKGGGELKTAELAFGRLLTPEFEQVKPAHSHGWLNLARVYLAYGGVDYLDKARLALEKASKCEPKAPWWTVAWFNGVINLQNANFEEAIKHFETILDPKNQDPSRKADYGKDFVVINELGKALFYRAQQEEGDPVAHLSFLKRAITRFEETLTMDAESFEAHEFLNKCYKRKAADVPTVAKIPGPPNDVEKHLIDGVEELTAKAPLSAQKRTELIADLIQRLVESESRKKEAPRAAFLVNAREKVHRIMLIADDEWLRLAVNPLLNTIDRQLLAQLPALGQAFADSKASVAKRTDAGEVLTQTLIQLHQRPPRPDIRPAMLPLAAYPMAGLPVNTALASLADRDYLAGGLAPTRWLSMVKLRQIVRPLAGHEQPEVIQHMAAASLARLHLILHGIFIPDTNAQDKAAHDHRVRYPAADQASHPIIVYSLNQKGAYHAPLLP